MVEIINQQNKHRLRLKHFRQLMESLVSLYHLPHPGLTIVFSNDRLVRQLNRSFRKKDKTTDVLSFPIGEKGPDGSFYLGDIIISVPQAQRQAKQKKQALEKELTILVIHGFLHLLGYEHGQGIEEEEAKVASYFKLG